MDYNPYAPPSAAVADLPQPYDAIADPPFFAVSRLKLGIMSVTTLGVYEVYWFYKNWRFVRDRERIDILPPARALFAFFFCYQLFARMRDYQPSANAGHRLPAGRLAIGWTFLTVLGVLPDPYWLVSGFSFLFLLPVQEHVNRVNAVAQPMHDHNTRFTGWNWLAMVIGGSVAAATLAAALFGLDSRP